MAPRRAPVCAGGASGRRPRALLTAWSLQAWRAVAADGAEDEVVFGAEPEVYAQPRRYAPTSADRPPRSRLEGLCRPLPLQPADLATFWLVTVWNSSADQRKLAVLDQAGVRALQLHPCVVLETKLQAFLDRAWTEGLRVVPQLPERLFDRDTGGCFGAGSDCYDGVRAWARRLLRTSLTRDGVYHPAVEMIWLLREPDASVGLPDGLTATLSAWDGWLDAEQELGVRAGPVGLATLLASAASGGPSTGDAAGKHKDVCYNLRAPHGCEKLNTLRELWSAANQTPGWYAPIAGQGRIRRGVDRGVDGPRYVSHSDLAASIAHRWVHTFPAAAAADDIIRNLREYYAFI